MSAEDSETNRLEILSEETANKRQSQKNSEDEDAQKHAEEETKENKEEDINQADIHEKKEHEVNGTEEQEKQPHAKKQIHSINLEDENIEDIKVPELTVPGNNNDLSYAPSFKDVNNNNEELAELRGEGRYFGVADPDASEPICSNCHQRGHKRAKCTVVVCHLCGKVGDHYESQCPISMVCSNCGKKGHYRNNCPDKRHYNYCTYCNSRTHSTDRCPNIWRSYIVKKISHDSSVRRDMYPSGLIFCYNCGHEGHFGDNCPFPRVSRTPNINGSAFTGENLPREFRNLYRVRLSEVKRRYHDRYRDDNTDRIYANRESSEDYSSSRKRKRRSDKSSSMRKRRKFSDNASSSYEARHDNNYSHNQSNNRHGHHHSSNNQNRGSRPSKSGFLPPRRKAQPTRSGYLNNRRR